MTFQIINDRIATPIATGRMRRISSTIEEMMTLHSVPPTSDPTMFDDEKSMANDEVDVLCDSRRDVLDVKSAISVDPLLNDLGDTKFTDVSDHSRPAVSSDDVKSSSETAE